MSTQLRLVLAHVILMLSLILTRSWIRSDVFAFVDTATVALLTINLLVWRLNEVYHRLNLNKMQSLLLGLGFIYLLFSVEITDSCLTARSYHSRLYWMDYVVESDQTWNLMFGLGLISWLLFVITAVFIWGTKLAVLLLMLAKKRNQPAIPSPHPQSKTI